MTEEQKPRYQIQKRLSYGRESLWIDVASREEAENNVIHGFRWRMVYDAPTPAADLAELVPDDWKQRAEAAEAKLAELEKQEPVGHFMLARDEDDSWWYEASEQNDKAIPLFTRPAPAADLAELVPDPAQNKYWDNLGYGTRFKVRDYHNDVVAILRKIEETK